MPRAGPPAVGGDGSEGKGKPGKGQSKEEEPPKERKSERMCQAQGFDIAVAVLAEEQIQARMAAPHAPWHECSRGHLHTPVMMVVTMMMMMVMMMMVMMMC